MTHGMEAERKRLAMVHIIEALMSAASNLLTIGVFFYMQHQFGWGLGRNFLLSAGLGTVYIVGALAAHPLTERFGRRGPMVMAYGILGVVTLIASLFPSPLVATATVLSFAFFSAMTWPIIEHLISVGDLHPHELSRRLSVYNVIWAAVGALVVAGNGLIIEMFTVGVFLIPCAACVLSALIALLAPIEPPNAEKTTSVHAQPEPQLERQRVMALWLARISVPAMYVMIYSLAPLFPSLPVVKPLRPAMQTLVSSIWLVSRWVAFLLLGTSVFWHTRPRLLLGAAVALLGSLLVITIPADLTLLIIGQIIFGASAGLIYMASLYFGMVLSEGSTEHGGYHEALIGLGMTLGPGLGAATLWLRPGDQRIAVAAIGGLVALSVGFAGYVSFRPRNWRA